MAHWIDIQKTTGGSPTWTATHSIHHLPVILSVSGFSSAHVSQNT